MTFAIDKNVSKVLLRRSTCFVALLQACMIALSLITAWFLRFDFWLPYRTALFSAVLILIIVRLAAIYAFGLLHGWWRYTGVSDVLDIAKAVVSGSAAFFVSINLMLRFRHFPRSIFVLEALLTFGFLAGARLMSRVFAESVRQDIGSSKKVAIIGAGFAAQMILREIRQYRCDYLAVLCVDDDSSKQRLKIQGVPVLGTINELPKLLERHPVDEILIAIPSATGVQMRRIISICENTGAKFRTIPALRELISGATAFHQLREVNLDDLLGREPIEMDLDAVESQIEDRTVLVTGAAGSIGSELCMQIIERKPRKVICLDQSEAGIFHLHYQLSKRNTVPEIVFCIADIRDAERISQIYEEHQPNVTFHAGAYKQVPMLESNVAEAVKNNIFGLLNVLDAAEENKCSSFVLISSDKAVNPTSVMGATKRAGELILSCRPVRGMRCVAVRFGNVLGSQGSVVPLLQEQIRNNQELTITHPQIRRFFMTNHEAVLLVLQAFALGRHGQILVLDMKQPVRILDLAQSLVRLSGKSPHDVKIRFTGLRPGEKMSEEMFYPNEKVLPTSCANIHKVSGQAPSWDLLHNLLNQLRILVTMGHSDSIRAKLNEIVPEYSCRTAVPHRSASRTNSAPSPQSARVAGAR